MPKEESPLQVIVRETVNLRKTVDTFLKTSATALKKKTTTEEQKKQIYQQAKSHLQEVIVELEKTEKLKPEDDPSLKPAKFMTKKNDEEKKLVLLKEKLERLRLNIFPDGDPDEKKDTHAAEETDDEEDDSEESEEDDEEDDASENTTEVKKVQSQLVKSEVEEDDDEEEESDDEDSHLKRQPVMNGARHEEDDEETDEDESVNGESEDEEDGSEENSDVEQEARHTLVVQGKANCLYEALADFEGEQEGDLPFKKGEILTIYVTRPDGWMEAESSAGNRGLVPVTFLKVHKAATEDEAEDSEEDDEEEDEDEASPRSKTPRSGRQLWKNIKDTMKETSATDVLHVLGAMPAGFRDSTLGALYTNDQYKLSSYLVPKLSPSCISYRDLFLDTSTGLVRSQLTKIQRIVQIVEAKQVPVPGVGVEVKSRHVRVCLFDGNNVLSNVHNIRISRYDPAKKLWEFSQKTTETLKSIEFAEFFVRSNASQSNIGILFELCVSYVRTSTSTIGEFSCGWVFLPLFDRDGRPVDCKAYEEVLHGGTPYEHGIEVNPTVGRTESASLLKSLMAGNKQPRLMIRLQIPTREQNTLMDTLPEVVVAPTIYIQYLSFYRLMLADKLLKETDDLQNSDAVHAELLMSFRAAVNQPDIIDVLRLAWAEAFKSAKRMERKDQSSLKQLFQQVFKYHVYPLLYTAVLPPYSIIDTTTEQTRVTEIDRMVRQSSTATGLSGLLLSSAVTYQAFDVRELAFSVVNDYSVAAH